MKPPQNNNDLQHLRSWIRQKYIDKHWCDNKGADGGGGGRGGTTTNSSSNSSSGTNGHSNKSTGRRKIMPKVKINNKEPPVPAQVAEPAHDPFGFDSIVPTSASTANDGGWDAFGGSSQQSSNTAEFQADFDNMNSTAPAPPAPAPSGNPQVMVHYHPHLGDQGYESTLLDSKPASGNAGFQADFGNFGSGQQPQQQLSQQPTMVALPPVGAQPHQQLQQQEMQQQNQPAFQANFGEMLTPSTQQQKTLETQQGFANFPSQGGGDQSSNSQGFANFASTQQPQMQQTMMGESNNMQMQGGGTMNSMQQQPAQGGMNNQPQNTVNQGAGMMNQQMNFGQFPQQQMIQQPPQPSVESDGFTNFSSVQSPSQLSQQQPTDQTQNDMQIPSQMQQPQLENVESDGFANFSSAQQADQTQNNVQMPPQPSMAQPMQDAATVTTQGSVADNSESEQQVNTEHQPPSLSNDLENNASEHSEMPAVNPNAFQTVDKDKMSAFDAFDGLSIEPTPPSYMASSSAATGANDIGASVPTSSSTTTNNNDLNFAPFKEGQQVMYTNDEGSCVATISKVHFDDELHPFYTININGREKQTDNAHLSELTQNVNSTPGPSVNNSNDDMLLLQETASMLQKLNSQQLMQVKQLVASMISSSESNNGQNSGAPLSRQNVEMNGNHHQNQMSFGSIDSTHSSMGSNIPAANMMMGQPSTFTSHQGIQMMPQMQPNNQNNQMQNLQQQQNNVGMGMGMGGSASFLPTPSPPSSMPPPPPVGHPPAEPSQQSTVNDAQTLAAVPPQQEVEATVAPTPTLPPVEKEGNPFDFY